MIQPLIALWIGCLVGLLVTPRGRAKLARCLADFGRVFGFDRGHDALRELVAEDAADPGLRRAAAVKDAYLAGEFGYDELDWRILLALMPPPSDREARVLGVGRPQGARVRIATHVTPWSAAAPSTESIPWTAAPRRIEEGPHCRFHELHSGSGYVDTVCDCGHVKEMHYPGGCNDCDAAFAPVQRIHASEFPVAPDPRLVDYREW